MVPSELVTSEGGWKQYKEWISSTASTKAVITGRHGIGKETSIRLINRIHNYKEIHVDSLYSREEVQEILKSIEKTNRAKDIRGRNRIFIFRDIDKQCFKQVLGVANNQTKIAIIDDNGALSRVYDGDKRCEIVKMYSDANRVHRRAESICRKIGIVLPEEISKRIREGDKIGKIVSEIEIFRRNRQIKASVSEENGSITCIDALDRILHRRKGVRSTYSEIERICEKAGAHTVQDMLFSNYLEKCLSIEDAQVLLEYTSLYDTPAAKTVTGYDTKCISLYQFHSMLYNTILVSFKPAIRKIAPEKSKYLYHSRYLSNLEIEAVREISSALVKKVKRARTPSQTDEYTKKSIRYILEGLNQTGIIEEDDILIMRSIDISATPTAQKSAIPRYIYKDGHSHYVTRDITLQEILR